MNKTNIEWVKNPDGTHGYTWNPITGCLNHNNGMCKGGGFPCYAYRLANGRLEERYLANSNYPETERYQRVPFYPRFWPERLEPIGLTGGKKRPHSYGYLGGFKEHKPKGIFVCDMGELFGDWIPEDWQQQIFEVIKTNPYHRFYLLTKQPQNLIKFSPFPENCWVGVTATRGRFYPEAMNALLNIDAKIKYLSIEPCLGPMPYNFSFKGLDWLIIGAQTRPYKPPAIEHVKEIVEVADRAGIPIFLKDNLRTLILDSLARHEIDRPHFLSNGELRQEIPE